MAPCCMLSCVLPPSHSLSEKVVPWTLIETFHVPSKAVWGGNAIENAYNRDVLLVLGATRHQHFGPKLGKLGKIKHS